MKRVYCFIVAFVVLVLVSCEPFPGPGNLAYGDVDDLESLILMNTAESCLSITLIKARLAR